MKNKLKKENNLYSDFSVSSEKESNNQLFKIIKIDNMDQSSVDKDNTIIEINQNDDSNIKLLEKKRGKGKNKKNGKIIAKPIPWTKEEDKLLLTSAKENNEKNWKKIASLFKGRSSIQCSSRYHRIKPGLAKGHFTREEDLKLISLYNTFGKKWNLIAKNMKNRSGKQVRDRFLNSLAPGVNKKKFTYEEDMKILKYYKIYGKSWSKISQYINGRTGDMIKNRFYSNLCKIYEKENYVNNNLVEDDEEEEEENNEKNEENKKNEKVEQKKDLMIDLNQNNKIINNNENLFLNNKINININNKPDIMYINNYFNNQPTYFTNILLSNLILKNNNNINGNNYNLNLQNYSNRVLSNFNSFNGFNYNYNYNININNANNQIPHYLTPKVNIINNVDMNQKLNNEINCPISSYLSLFDKI